MGRIVTFLYGVVVYAMFFVTFCYLIGFVGNCVVPITIDSGEAGPVGMAILVNGLLLAAFAVQHTIMARPAFKAWWTNIVPTPAERSTFVLATVMVLWLMVWQWRPIHTTIWHVENSIGWGILYAISLAGWTLVLYSTFVIDHFDLIGLRQVFIHLRGKEYTQSPFVERTLYRFVRHPLLLGFMIAFWSTPDMTGGHLLFAVVITAYTLIGIQFEERDLLGILGEDYRRYRLRTPMLIPMPWKKAAATPASAD